MGEVEQFAALARVHELLERYRIEVRDDTTVAAKDRADLATLSGFG
jgi:hypothetical protein